MSAKCRFCCKSRKLQSDCFFVKTRDGRQSLIRPASLALPKSPVSLPCSDEVPRIFTRKPHRRPAEFLNTSAKRLLQHYRHLADIRQFGRACPVLRRCGHPRPCSRSRLATLLTHSSRRRSDADGQPIPARADPGRRTFVLLLQNKACKHAGTKRQQSDKYAAAENHNCQPRAQRFTDGHADECCCQCDQRGDRNRTIEPVVESKPQRESHGRDKCRNRQRLHQLVLFEVERLYVGDAWDDKNPRRAVDKPCCESDQWTKQGFGATRHVEMNADQAYQGIDHQDHAEKCGC